MTTTIDLLAEKFPEPAFSTMQGQVFAAVQRESVDLAQVLMQEAEAQERLKSTSNQPQMVRFGAYSESQLIGWSCGWMERGGSFYMANSGVLPSFQRTGVYTALLKKVTAYASESGATAVRSQHSIINNAVIICKLKNGFHISGLSTAAHMGMLVELTLHLSALRTELFRSRVIPFVPQSDNA